MKRWLILTAITITVPLTNSHADNITTFACRAAVKGSPIQTISIDSTTNSVLINHSLLFDNKELGISYLYAETGPNGASWGQRIYNQTTGAEIPRPVYILNYKAKVLQFVMNHKVEGEFKCKTSP